MTASDRPAVIEAIRQCGGCVTTLGVIGPRRCDACGEPMVRGGPNQYIGGVWTKGSDARLAGHHLVCKACFDAYCSD